MRRAVIAIVLTGCGSSYSADDTTANTIAARQEARLYDLCASDDAGACTPGAVRAHSTLSFCANARELVVHRQPVPEGGVGISCQPQ